SWSATWPASPGVVVPLRTDTVTLPRDTGAWAAGVPAGDPTVLDALEGWLPPPPPSWVTAMMITAIAATTPAAMRMLRLLPRPGPGAPPVGGRRSDPPRAGAEGVVRRRGWAGGETCVRSARGRGGALVAAAVAGADGGAPRGGAAVAAAVARAEAPAGAGSRAAAASRLSRGAGAPSGAT